MTGRAWRPARLPTSATPKPRGRAIGQLEGLPPPFIGEENAPASDQVARNLINEPGRGQAQFGQRHAAARGPRAPLS